MGFRVFLLCLRQVINNAWIAFRLSGLWIALAVGYIVLLVLISVALMEGDQSWLGTILMVVLVLTAAPITVLAICSIAVGWHRFILLDETPDRFVLMMRNWPIGSYFLTGLKIFALFFLIMFPLLFLSTGVFAVTVGPGGAPSITTLIFAFLLLLAVNTVLMWLVLRVGLSLPAAALGNRMGLRQSFKATKPLSGALVITAICIMALNIVPTLLSDFGALGENSELVALILLPIHLFLGWLSFFVGFGILTVLYGHLIEGRPI